MRASTRHFILAIAGVLCLSVPALGAEFGVTLAYVGPEPHAALLGVKQGVEEANVQGRFLGQRYHLSRAVGLGRKGPEPANLAAILAVLDEPELRRLAAERPSLPILNLTDDGDGLRERCMNNVLHIPPSTHMKEDALGQWRKLHPRTRAAARAWHPDFVKYSAEQLNKRYRKAWGEAMDDAAWAGWAAVKLVSDSVARLGTTEPAKLLDYLKNDLSFDGQKGIDMSFRPDGQLRQVLLLVENDKIVAEAPVQGVAEPEQLDTLGATACTGQ
ncbi:MAG: ABC transporter substrate-binding protein [Gammaproteobacteria bacterium]